MNSFEAIILAIIEGLTEFLPVSSTGHMIIASSFMGIASDPFVKLFTIAIQLGAILSVVVLYFKRFFKSINFYIKLLVAFIPAAVFGLLLSKKIDELLESPMAVGISLLVGGVILLFVDKWFNNPTVNEEEDISYLTALKIGFFQCIAMIPGVSRSGITLTAALLLGMRRKEAGAYSFLLSLPIILAGILKEIPHLMKANDGQSFAVLASGVVSSFLVGWLTIHFFMKLIGTIQLKYFAIYRWIVAALIFFTLMY